MKIYEFWGNLRELYPDSLSSDWDNDGLMCCPDKNAPVKRVLCALDATMDVLEYAVRGGFDTVLAHHPMIFRGLKSVTEDSFAAKRVIYALENKLSVISLHTRLDAGVGGVNDTLAEILELRDIRYFGSREEPQIGRMGKTDKQSADAFGKRIKESLAVPNVAAYTCRDVENVAVIGGGGKDFIFDAIAAGADTLVTGEVGYNDGIDAAEAGLNVFAAGHFGTEFPVCETLRRLARDMAGAEAEIYKNLQEKYF